MIDHTLRGVISSRYPHAARHLLACESLAARITDFGNFDTHVTYGTGLRRQHGRKAGFWSLLKE